LTSLTFFGGVNEIGGNKILLEDKDTKVFLDFGLSFGVRGTYFDEFIEYWIRRLKSKFNF